MTAELKQCLWCGADIQPDEWCPHCIEEMKARRDPKQMTADERLAELDWFYDGPGDRIMVPFALVHKRFEDLCGGPVWTHELIQKDHIRQMAASLCRTTSPIDTIPAGKDVIVVTS